MQLIFLMLRTRRMSKSKWHRNPLLVQWTLLTALFYDVADAAPEALVAIVNSEANGRAELGLPHSVSFGARAAASIPGDVGCRLYFLNCLTRDLKESRFE